MSNNDEKTFWVLEENDAFIARKVSGRNFRFVTDEVVSSPSRKAVLAGRPIWPMKDYDPYDQAYWGKGKGKKGKKGKSKFQYSFDGNKGFPSYDNGKGKGGLGKEKPKRSQPSQRSRSC